VPKWTALGVGLAALLALSACDNDPSPVASASPFRSILPSAEPTVPVPSDPGRAFAAAGRHLTDEPFKAKFSSIAQEATASIDPKGKVSEIATLLQNGATITVRQFTTEQYVEVTGDTTDALHAVPGKWMRIDTVGLPAGNPLSPAYSQATSSAGLLKASTGVRLDGTGTYTGKVDLSRGGASKIPSSLAGKLKAVPFTTTIDPRGRFTSLTVDFDSVISGAGRLKTSYYDYGVPVDVARPAASDTVPMPDTFKKSIGLS
jgi:hypothetical protein